MQSSNQELINTIVGLNVFSGEELKYDPITDGRHVFGLIGIRNCKKRKFKSNEEVDAFRFIFRHKDLANGYVNHTVTAVLSEKSSLFKLLKSMNDGKTGKTFTKNDAFQFMLTCVGKWFEIMVENKEWKGRQYLNIVNSNVLPYNGGAELGDSVAFFEKRHLNENADTAKESSGQSVYDWKSLASYPFYYELGPIQESKRRQAIQLCQLSHGECLVAETELWGVKNEIPPLQKYRISPSSDVIPF